MTRIITIGVVRHDTDILETCLRHAMSFADVMLLRLHRPTPALRAMAAALRDEGMPLELSESAALHYDQETAMNELLTEAVALHGADWVLPLDADELPGGDADLRAAIAALPADTPVSLPWRTYVPTPGDDPREPCPARRIRHRLAAEVPGFSKVLIPAARIRGTDARLTLGSHAVETGGVMLGTAASPLFLAHYPVRSDGQLRTKILCGWLSHEANPARKPGQIFQWERLFERCKDTRPIDAAELQAIASSYAQDAPGVLVDDPLPVSVPALRLAQETQDSWTLFRQDAALFAARP